MRAVLLSLFTVLLLLVNTTYGSNEETWTQANAAFDQKNFDSAIEGYRLLLERDVRQPVVYYNLGNAYFKNNKIGMAIAAYRHCLKIDPSFNLAKENLSYVRKYTVDRVEDKPKGFLLNIWFWMTGIFSAEGFFVFAIISYWGLCLIITLMVIGLGKKEFLSYLLILSIAMFILSAVITHSVIDETINTKWGVITVASAELREGPGEDFTKIFTGHEGLEFKVLSRRQDYCLVELANGLKGWIKASTLTEI